MAARVSARIAFPFWGTSKVLPSSLNELSEALLRQLCDDRCSESPTLDFKAILPERDDKGRAELLKDVCAFANSEGGDLVYGIRAKDGKAEAVVPIVGETFDAASLRLGQILESVEPRLLGHGFREVPVLGGYVLVLRVPASFENPHRFMVNKASRFVIRSGTHTSDMTYEQLRAAFGRTATLVQQAKALRQSRLEQIQRRDVWQPDPPGPVCVVHVLPLAAFANRIRVDIPGLHDDGFMNFALREMSGGVSRTTNLEGLVITPGRPWNHSGVYLQIFRVGVFEAAARMASKLDSEPKSIHGKSLASFIRNTTINIARNCGRLRIEGPAVYGISVVNVDCGLVVGARHGFSISEQTSPGPFVVPDFVVDDLGQLAANPDGLVRDALDTIWQCFGEERCEAYSPDGKWLLA